jgi:type I restriction enzyme S subunit
VERGDDQLPLLSVTQASGVIPQGEAGRRNISSEDQSNYKTVRAGDIAYNTMRMWQGASALSTLTGKVSPAYTIVTPRKGHDAVFYAYLFKQPKMIHVFERHSQGLVSDTWNLKYPHLAKIRTCVPDIEEQRAIAAAFRSLDDSTRAYETQLAALRQEKAALMQQLLTGKRRVKLPESEVA